MTPEFYMQLAYDEAKKAAATDEVPIGAVVVDMKDGEVVSAAHNLSEHSGNASDHAEMLALRQACEKLGTNRLRGMELYVTLEPCPMCAWAVLNSRLEEVYFGSYDLKYGALGSKINLVNISNFKTKVFGGIMEDECNKILKDYFLELRK